MAKGLAASSDYIINNPASAGFFVKNSSKLAMISLRLRSELCVKK